MAKDKITVPTTDVHRMHVMSALHCLEDNGIEKDECPIVLQALCYILFDVEIDDLLCKEDYEEELA